MRKVFLVILALFIAAAFNYQSSFAAVVVTPSESNIMIPSNPDPAKVKAALEEFKHLSRKEKKERFKELRAVIKQYKKEKRSGGDVDTNTILLALIALILPPLAVYLHENDTNNKFWIDLVLAILGIVGVFALGWYCWLAAVIYALVIVLQTRYDR